MFKVGDIVRLNNHNDPSFDGREVEVIRAIEVGFYWQTTSPIHGNPAGFEWFTSYNAAELVSRAFPAGKHGLTLKSHTCSRGSTPIMGMVICRECGRDIEPFGRAK